MAVGDSTGGFQHTQNNTGAQIQSASSNIAGTIGEMRDVPMPEAAHKASNGELAGMALDGLESAAGWVWDGATDLYGTVKSGAGKLWDNTLGDNAFWRPETGGSDGIFVGMDTKNIDNFKTALKTYIDGAQEILDGLNLDPSMEVTLKGSAIEDSFHEFLDAIKTLLSAYVQSLHALDKEIDEAAQNYESAQQKIGSDVSSDAGEIRSQAGSIDVA